MIQSKTSGTRRTATLKNEPNAMNEEETEHPKATEAIRELEQDLHSMRPAQGQLEWDTVHRCVVENQGQIVPDRENNREEFSSQAVQPASRFSSRALALSWAGGMLAGGLLVFAFLGAPTLNGTSGGTNFRPSSRPNAASRPPSTERVAVDPSLSGNLATTQSVDQLMDRSRALAVGSHFVFTTSDSESAPTYRRQQTLPASASNEPAPAVNPPTRRQLLRELIDDPSKVL